MERDHLTKMNGDMVFSVVDFLNNGGDDDDLEMGENGGLTSKYMKCFKIYLESLKPYCKELSVFGFNSAGYDIKLIKKFVFKELCDHDQQPIFTVKNARLESTYASSLNTLNSWTFFSL